MRVARRSVMALLLLAVAPAPTWAQVPVIGHLGLASAETGRPYIARVKQHLKELGHEEGRTFVLEERWAGGDIARYRELARDLLARRPAVISAACGGGLFAIREISRSVPVIAGCTDPKNYYGEIANVSRPGGQTTGFTFLAPESIGKRLQLLKALVPTLSRLVVVYNPLADWSASFHEIDRAAPPLGLNVSRVPVFRTSHLERAFAWAAEEGAQAVLLFPDTVTHGSRPRIAALALQHRLPTAFDDKRFVADGGLMSYGADTIAFGARVIAAYADKILKGAHPGDLPVQQPTHFQLTVNLTTAQALGLAVPESFLAHVDEVIR